MGAYVGAFFIFAYIFISENKWLSLLSAPIIAPFLYFLGLIFPISCTRPRPFDVIIISLYSNISSVLPLSFLQKREQRQPLPSGIRILGTPKHVFRVTPGGSAEDRVLRCRRRG